MRKKAYLLGREMIWSQVAHQYMASYQQARQSRQAAPLRRLAMLTLDEQVAKLPNWRFDHLETLTDSTGILQHATYTIPNRVEGNAYRFDRHPATCDVYDPQSRRGLLHRRQRSRLVPDHAAGGFGPG
jgi:hypothetical protein